MKLQEMLGRWNIRQNESPLKTSVIQISSWLYLQLQTDNNHPFKAQQLFAGEIKKLEANINSVT